MISYPFVSERFKILTQTDHALLNGRLNLSLFRYNTLSKLLSRKFEMSNDNYHNVLYGAAVWASAA